MTKIINDTYKLESKIEVGTFDSYLPGIPTENMWIDNEAKYSLSDLISLLEAAKERWGDVPVRLSDVSFESNRYNDTVPVSQLYLFKDTDGKEFCVIESEP